VTFLTRSTAITSKTGFAAESEQNGKKVTFSSLRGLTLCTSHILDFGRLHVQPDALGFVVQAQGMDFPPGGLHHRDV